MIKKFLHSLSLVVLLSLAAPPAHGGETPDPAVEELFRLGGEDVSYDPESGALVPLAEVHPLLPATAPAAALVSLLPEAIPAPYAKPMIAIVIDDMGVNQKNSARAAHNLKPRVTLSYLAYAPHVREQVAEAKKLGHEIFLHLPWEPDRTRADPGPHYLSSGMPEEKLRQNLLANLDAFDGYAGVNNHMGSKFSRHRPGLEIVMRELEKRGLFFLDSRTTPDSLAEKTARAHGVPSTRREVFLDHAEKPEFIAAALKETENIARRTGAAVAIGHPKDATLDALEAWLPTLEGKGFEIAPVTTVIKYRESTAGAHVAHLNPGGRVK